MLKKTVSKLKQNSVDPNTAENFLLTWKISVSIHLHNLSNMYACFIWKITCALHFFSPQWDNFTLDLPLNENVSTLAHSGYFHGHIFSWFYYFCSWFVITKHYRIKYDLSSNVSFHFFQWSLWIRIFFHQQEHLVFLLFSNESISLKFFLSFTYNQVFILITANFKIFITESLDSSRLFNVMGCHQTNDVT